MPTPNTPRFPELSQTVTSTNNGVTVRYPAGWLPPIADVGVFLYNNPVGQAFFSFYLMEPGGLAFQINTQGNPAGMTPEALFALSFDGLAQGLGIPLSAPERVRAGSVDALRAMGRCERVAVYVALIPTSDAVNPFATFAAYAHPAEIEAHLPLFDAMLATVSVRTP